MPAFSRSKVSLRLTGDDLIPSEVNALLGIDATVTYRKGEELIGKTFGIARIAKTGHWRLLATPKEPEDIEAQIFELLHRLTQDLDAWRKLSTRFNLELFCGLFMGSENDGFSLSDKVMLALGQRGIKIGFDVYDSHI